MLMIKRTSALSYELRFPLNNGVSELTSNGNLIVAVCQDRKIYLWDWSNPTKKPRTVTAESDQTLITKAGLVISTKRLQPQAIIVSDIQGQQPVREIPLKAGANRVFIGASRDKTAIIVALAYYLDKTGTKKNYQLVRPEPNSGHIENIIDIHPQTAAQPTKLAVSEDGSLALMIGEQEKKGWMVLVDVRNKKVLWEKQTVDVEKFHSADFSPDGKFIYARGTNTTLYKIDPNSGSIVDRWLAGKKSKSTAGQTSVQDVAVSPNGCTVASIVGVDIFVWNCTNGKKILRVTPGHKIESGLAFSPDGRFVASSDLRQGGTIKIWRVPTTQCR